MQCTATRRDKTRCHNDAIKGGNVCRMHGGGAPQVKAKAAERLAALIDPAIGVLTKSMKRFDKIPQVALAAAKDVLDRNGFKPADRHILTGLDGGPMGLNVSATDELLSILNSIAARGNPKGSDN